jgi:chaperonin cofactor prefoldin
MSSIISPEDRDLQQKYEEMRVILAKTQGEVEEIKRNSERNDQQTNKQFVIFLVTMTIAVAGSLIGTSIFQTDALRREMNARFETVNQRIENVEKEVKGLDKRMERIEKSLDDLNKELRAQRK